MRKSEKVSLQMPLKGLSKGFNIQLKTFLVRSRNVAHQYEEIMEIKSSFVKIILLNL